MSNWDRFLVALLGVAYVHVGQAFPTAVEVRLFGPFWALMFIAAGLAALLYSWAPRQWIHIISGTFLVVAAASRAVFIVAAEIMDEVTLSIGEIRVLTTVWVLIAVLTLFAWTKLPPVPLTRR